MLLRNKISTAPPSHPDAQSLSCNPQSPSWLLKPIWVGFSLGLADLTAPKFDFRSSPKSGLKSDIGPCPVRAKTGSRHPNGSGSRRLADDDDAESGSAIVNPAAHVDRGARTAEIRRRRPGDAGRHGTPRRCGPQPSST